MVFTEKVALFSKSANHKTCVNNVPNMCPNRRAEGTAGRAHIWRIMFFSFSAQFCSANPGPSLGLIFYNLEYRLGVVVVPTWAPTVGGFFYHQPGFHWLTLEWSLEFVWVLRKATATGPRLAWFRITEVLLFSFAFFSYESWWLNVCAI